MLRPILFCMLSISIFIFNAACFAEEIRNEILGVKLPNSLVLKEAKEKIWLKGYGVESNWGNTKGNAVYVAALYTENIKENAQMLLLNDKASAMFFYFVKDDIASAALRNYFTEAIWVNNKHWNKGIMNNAPIDELQACLKEGVNAGDVLAFYYSPQKGLTLLRNDQETCHWADAKAFYNMLLGIWIGPYPPSRAFKEAILR